MNKIYNPVQASPGMLAVYATDSGPVGVPVLFFYQYHDNVEYQLDAAVEGHDSAKKLVGVDGRIELLGFSQTSDLSQSSSWFKKCEERVAALEKDLKEKDKFKEDALREAGVIRAKIEEMERDKKDNWTKPGYARSKVSKDINEAKERLRQTVDGANRVHSMPRGMFPFVCVGLGRYVET